MTQRNQIAFHESCHAVVAVALGFAIMEIRISDYEGYCLFGRMSRIDDNAGIAVAAGVVANDDFLKIADDHAKSRDLALMNSMARTDDVKDQWRAKAKQIIEANLPVIEELARSIVSDFTLEELRPIFAKVNAV